MQKLDVYSSGHLVKKSSSLKIILTQSLNILTLLKIPNDVITIIILTAIHIGRRGIMWCKPNPIITHRAKRPTKKAIVMSISSFSFFIFFTSENSLLKCNCSKIELYAKKKKAKAIISPPQSV